MVGVARLERVPRRLRAREVLGRDRAADDGSVVLLDVAQRRVGQEEPDHGEHLLVLGELHARCLRGSVPMGLIGANTGTIFRPLMPPLALRSSITALYAFS